jgi:hypothetical protein
MRQLIHNGRNQWSLSAGSAGGIEDLAVEETVKELSQAALLRWVARGETNRTAYGFGEKPYEITLELKSGEKHSIEFGGNATASSVFSAVILDGQVWIGEFPSNVFGHVKFALTAP